MRLAVIRRHSSPTGGAELYVQRLIEALAGAGHEVHLLCEAWEAPPPGVTVHRVDAKAGRARRPIAFADAIDGELARHSFDCVFSLERTRRQDVYRAGDGVHRVWLARRAAHAPWWKRPFVGLGAFHRNVCRLEAETFDPGRTRRVIVNSRMVAGEIDRCFGFPRDRVHLVRNGIVISRFAGVDRAAARVRFGLQPHEFVFLFVGSGWERKGLPQLVAAMRRPELARAGTRLLVVGKGRIGNLPANVSLAGPVREIEQAYAAADLLAFLPIYEPSSNVVPEALASGLPVVTSKGNGAAEWLRPGIDGDIVDDPDDTPAVAAVLAKWRDRGTRRIVRDPEEFGIERNVRETIAVLESAARERTT
jgi:UDP-glucose:(heptosyl)LPS alpha-1,3-glucosyltransferase